MRSDNVCIECGGMYYDDQMSKDGFTCVYCAVADEAVAEEREAKDRAYSERDRLVALLSTCFPSWLERHPDTDESWEDDWRWIVFVNLPTGQASWHIHDSELEWFDHLERLRVEEPSWDGHSTEEKYQRVFAAIRARGERDA